MIWDDLQSFIYAFYREPVFFVLALVLASCAALAVTTVIKSLNERG